jgi:hypothetical protein
VRLSSELQRVQLAGITRAQTLAMFINLYNTLVIHAYIHFGPPTTSWQRRRFFYKAAYMIGGHAFSLNDIEHGILRSNRKQPFAFQRQFAPSDPRRQYVLPNVDPRIHFALVCGAKGCPPIKNYSYSAIDEQLDEATMAFLEGECVISVEKRTVQLSMLFKWYRRDFGATDEQVLSWVAAYLDPQRKEQIETLLQTPDQVRITYSEYDWSHNTKQKQ